LARHGEPDIFNTDQGSQFTGAAFTGVLANNGIAISMDGKVAWRDNVFVERLWRSVKYEEVYLRAYDSVSEARSSLDRYLLTAPHPIKPTSPRCRSASAGLTLAEAPLIDAEKLFRRPGPQQTGKRMSWKVIRYSRNIFAIGLIGTLAIELLLISSVKGGPESAKKQYWATSLSAIVDEAILVGLREAVARGEVGWLDNDLNYPTPPLEPGINLILYHVGGNCYIGSDCRRFPSSKPTGDRWDDAERMIDLEDPAARKIVIADLVKIVEQGDRIAPNGSIVGVHVDNVHMLGAAGLATVFNEFLLEVETARQQGRISKTRRVGYVAKNSPRGFREALDQKLLDAPPLYVINENARLNQNGILNSASRTAQEIGRRCDIPIFLKTFGSDVAFTIEQNGIDRDVPVSKEMARQMAQMPNISGVAWSVDESSYHPILFVQGSPVQEVPSGSLCRD